MAMHRKRQCGFKNHKIGHGTVRSDGVTLIVGSRQIKFISQIMHMRDKHNFL